MTPHQHVYETIKSVGIPGALQAFPVPDADGTGGAPPPPFFVYMMDDDGSVEADDTDYTSVPSFRVELYERSADQDLENRVAQAIRSEFGPCSIMEDWIESERARMVTYSFSYTPKTA